MPAARTSAPPPPLGWWGHTWRLLVVVLVSGAVWSLTAANAETVGGLSERSLAWIAFGDPGLGVVALVLSLFRRRAPLLVAVATTLASGVSTAAVGPATLALCSLATRRRPVELAVMVPVGLASSLVFELTYPQDDALPLWVAMLLGLVYLAVAIAVGSSVGADRERLATLRDRAETAEREQLARVAAARAAERTRIAREMHDVLAHRISLVSMHAGALTFRDDLPREQQLAVARTIEENAHLALRDLRDVLGVLRAEGGSPSGEPERPQPGFADLGHLVEEARAAGATVTVEDATADPVPATLGRTVYRVVQESLTNARKHAPGTHVTVTVSGSPGADLTVVVANPTPVRPPGAVPGSGLGLLGLAERVDLLGGTLTSGADRDRFVVRASLPWPT